MTKDKRNDKLPSVNGKYVPLGTCFKELTDLLEKLVRRKRALLFSCPSGGEPDKRQKKKTISYGDSFIC